MKLTTGLLSVTAGYLWLRSVWGPNFQEHLSASLGPGCFSLALLFPTPIQFSDAGKGCVPITCQSWEAVWEVTSDPLV